MLTAVQEANGQDNCGDLFDAGGAQLTDHQAERLLLGYLLCKPAAVTETIEIIGERDLHDPLHRRIYEGLCRAYETGAPVTMEGLVAALGGSKMFVPALASLMASADMTLDVGEIAEHLQAVGERRAVGTADDDDYVGGQSFTSKFGALRWEDIAQSSGNVGYSWFVEDIIPMGEISLVFGDSGSGKSFGMFDMVMCAARHTSFYGHNVEPGLCVYVAAEAGKGFAKRKLAYAIQHRLEPSEPLPFVLLTRRPNFFHDDVDVLALIEEIRAIARMYKQRLVCIVIDTLSALAPGMNENASADVSAVRRRLIMLQEQFEAAIILVHHKPKNGSTPRGHGSLTADFETTIEFEKTADRHRAIARKQREGKDGQTWEFRLSVIEVGRNKWGNPETSCVVQPCVSSQAASQVIGFHATPTEMLFMRALYDCLVDHPLPPPAGLPASITKVTEVDWVRGLMRERTIPAHEDNSAADNRFRVAFKRAGDKLRDGSVIGVQGRLLWATGKPVNGFTS